MRAMFLREIRILARTRALAAALGAHVMLLAAFVILWGGGVPLLPGADFYEQQRLVQWGILAALLPWVASRCGGEERGDALVFLSGLTAVPPSRIIAARILARAVACTLVVISGLPAMVLAEQMSAVPLVRPVVDLVPPIALGCFASAAAVCWSTLNIDVVLAWVAATLTVLIVVAVTFGAALHGSNAAQLAAIGVLVAALCSVRADSLRRFLSERRA